MSRATEAAEALETLRDLIPLIILFFEEKRPNVFLETCEIGAHRIAID